MQPVEDVREIIDSSHAILVYLSTPDCNVCKVLKPKIRALIEDEFPYIDFLYVDCLSSPEVAAQFSVFTVPTILVYFQGKETIRKSRNVGIDELRRDVGRPYSLYFDSW